MKKLSWFVFLSFIAISCLDQPDCFQLNNDRIVINFKVIGFNYDILKFSGVAVSGSETMFATDTVLSSITVPLNPLATHVDYTIKTDNATNFISLDYKRQVQFVSSDCGERYIYSDLKITDSSFDNITVVNGTPTTTPSSNIDILRCAVTNLMGITFANDVIVKNVTNDYDNLVLTPKDDTLHAAATYLFPLNVKKDTTTLNFNYANGQTKKLIVTYSNLPKLLDDTCGNQNILADLAKVDANYTTVTLTSPKIQDPPVSNFAITP